MYDALELSKYIIAKCVKDEQPISNLQLQKILYYIQKCFVQADRLAFSDDIEAWRFGPVVPNVYYYFCGSGALPIILPYKGEKPESCDKVTIDSIVEEKRAISPWDMVHDTHKKGGAWDRVYKGGLGDRHTIPIQLIKDYG